MSTGSLGQGRFSCRRDGAGAEDAAKNDAYTYLILGDGECDEGQVWERWRSLQPNKSWTI